MVLKSDGGGEEVADLLLGSKNKGRRPHRWSPPTEGVVPPRCRSPPGEWRRSRGNTIDAPATDDLTSVSNSMAVECGEEKKN
jgi:hypothetical protein